MVQQASRYSQLILRRCTRLYPTSKNAFAITETFLLKTTKLSLLAFFQTRNKFLQPKELPKNTCRNVEKSLLLQLNRLPLGGLAIVGVCSNHISILLAVVVDSENSVLVDLFFGL